MGNQGFKLGRHDGNNPGQGEGGHGLDNRQDGGLYLFLLLAYNIITANLKSGIPCLSNEPYNCTWIV